MFPFVHMSVSVRAWEADVQPVKLLKICLIVPLEGNREFFHTALTLPSTP